METNEATAVEISSGEVEKLAVRLAKEGYPPSKIGILLRDQYGVGDVKKVTGKSLTQILAASGLKYEIPEDLINLLKEAVKLHNHLAKNKKDQVSKHALGLVEGKINRLAKYYVRTGKLPKGWRYDPEKAALLVR